MLFMAIFQPTLMLLGLVFASITTQALVGFINETFLLGTSSLGDIYDPIGVIIMVGIQAILYYNVIIRSYRLVSMVPEFASSYMASQGTGRDNTHQEAVGFLNSSRSNATSAGKQIAGRTRGVAGNLAQQRASIDKAKAAAANSKDQSSPKTALEDDA